ncbi:MAG: VanW family protein, partial [Actinomyces sp.]|uniref:VanW family protein n=1 Tax=Actinomyces sp. TaxID=29317 RepID=UPI0026DB2BFD
EIAADAVEAEPTPEDEEGVEPEEVAPEIAADAVEAEPTPEDEEGIEPEADATEPEPVVEAEEGAEPEVEQDLEAEEVVSQIAADAVEAEPMVEAVAEPAPEDEEGVEPEADAAVITADAAEPEPVVEAVAEPGVEAVAGGVVVAVAEPVVEAEAEPAPEDETGTEPDTDQFSEPVAPESAAPEAEAAPALEGAADTEPETAEEPIAEEPVFVLPAAIPPAARATGGAAPGPTGVDQVPPTPVAGVAQNDEPAEDVEEPAGAGGSGTGASVLVNAEHAVPETPEPNEALEPDEPIESAEVTEAAAALQPAARSRVVKTAAATGVLSRIRRLPRGRVAGIATAAILLLVWGGAAWVTTLSTSAGATIAGVDVGGMSSQEARAAVESSMTASLSQPVTVTVTDSSDQLVPAESGVTVDAAASVRQLTGFTLNPVTIIQRLTGPEVEAVTVVDDKALTAALNDRLPALSIGTVNATVALEGTTPVVTPAANGTGLDVAATVSALSQNWPLGESSIALQEGVAVPAITDEDAATFVDGTLTPLLSGDLTITAAGTSVESKAVTQDLVLTPEEIAALLTISTEGGDLSAVLNNEALHAAILAAMGEIEVPAQDATWTIDGTAAGAATATPQYVAPSTGEGVDMAALSTALIEAGSSGTTPAQRTVPLPVTVLEPTNTTPQDQWGIVEVVGEYSTPFTSDSARDQNLTRGAELMNGQVVQPGQTFSVNDALGEVDAEHGFAAAGVISNGEHVDAMGGGLSQIGTTMFNAGFEAGMDDVEHHPHSYWFERYPAGREATIWTGDKDVKFANTTPYAVLIQAWVADGQVHARIWSTHYYDVTITSGERYNYRPIQTVTRPAGPSCTPYGGGSAGFDIVVTRTRTAPDKTVPDDVLTTSYQADNTVLCVAGASSTSSAAPSAGTATDSGSTPEQAATTQDEPAPANPSTRSTQPATAPTSKATSPAPVETRQPITGDNGPDDAGTDD